MGVDNIIVEILVILVGRELVTCVQPQNEMDAQILLALMLQVCLVEIDDIPKYCCHLEVVPLRAIFGLLRHTLDVDHCEFLAILYSLKLAETKVANLLI